MYVILVTSQPRTMEPFQVSYRAQLLALHSRTQENGAVTLQETDPDLPVSVQESLVEACVSGGLLQSWGP